MFGECRLLYSCIVTMIRQRIKTCLYGISVQDVFFIWMNHIHAQWITTARKHISRYLRKAEQFVCDV
jgi:hypothetical protein